MRAFVPLKSQVEPFRGLDRRSPNFARHGRLGLAWKWILVERIVGVARVCMVRIGFRPYVRKYSWLGDDLGYGGFLSGKIRLRQRRK